MFFLIWNKITPACILPIAFQTICGVIGLCAYSGTVASKEEITTAGDELGTVAIYAGVQKGGGKGFYELQRSRR